MYPAWLTVMAISVSAIRSSSLISSTLSTICVRRASPKSFCISRSSVMITALSFFSLARIERNSAISAWISFNSLDRKSTRLNSSHCNLVCRLLLEKKGTHPRRQSTPRHRRPQEPSHVPQPGPLRHQLGSHRRIFLLIQRATYLLQPQHPVHQSAH